MLGSDAESAVPALSKALGDPTHPAFHEAAPALKSIGERGLSVLAAALDSEQEVVRRQAMRVLESMGPMARPALAQLRKCLSVDDRAVRLGAARTLGEMGDEARTAVAALAKMLRESRDRQEIWTAAGALARIGPAANAQLCSLLNSRSMVRSAAAIALAAGGRPGEVVLAEKLGPSDIPGLVDALDSEDRQFPWWVTRALEIIGPDALPALAEILADGSPEAQLAAIYVFIRTGKANESAIQSLICALDSNDRQVRWRALYALQSIGPESRAAIPTLIRIAGGDEYFRMSHGAIRVLGVYGPEAEPAIAVLTRSTHQTTVKTPTRTDTRTSRSI
jgi:HEAT repeat protein